MIFEDIKNEIRECNLCELSKTRTKIVFDDLSMGSKIILVGEAPGGHEDTVSGKPFSGQAGKLLDEFLFEVGIERSDLYISNTVKCRPVKESSRPRYGKYANRKPTSKEIKCCLRYLYQEIEIIKPEIIVTLGGVPLTALTGKNLKLAEQHGEKIFLEDKNLVIFPIYHPASVIYNRDLKDVYLNDLRKLGELIRKERSK